MSDKEVVKGKGKGRSGNMGMKRNRSLNGHCDSVI